MRIDQLRWAAVVEVRFVILVHNAARPARRHFAAAVGLDSLAQSLCVPCSHSPARQVEGRVPFVARLQMDGCKPIMKFDGDVVHSRAQSAELHQVRQYGELGALQIHLHDHTTRRLRGTANELIALRE